MKKKTTRRHHVTHHAAHHHHASRTSKDYIVVVRGWMFLVLFAIMLGIGAVVGSFINQQVNSAPVVAGVQTAK